MRNLRIRAILTILAVCVSLGAWAQEKKGAAVSSANLSFVVLKDTNGKPVRNASVILHPVEEDGSQGKGGLQLKTDPEGKASTPGVPFGKVRIQVLARGFQTFGEDFDINQEQQEITIKLKPPAEQYSIYK